MEKKVTEIHQIGQMKPLQEFVELPCNRNNEINSYLPNLFLKLRASLCKILISSFAHRMDFAHNLSVDFFQ